MMKYSVAADAKHEFRTTPFSALIAISNEVPLENNDILDNYDGRDGKFIRGFLLNDKRNKNGWQVDWDVIKKYASDFINHPGIYFKPGPGEPDHTGGETYKDNMMNQEEYRVVNIVDVIADDATKTLSYVGEIIDEDFEQLYEAGKVNMTSPAVWPIEMDTVGTMENGRPMLDVKKYRALHVAYIDSPAYGDDAFTLATCDGPGGACKLRLSAKTEVPLFGTDLGPLQEVPLLRKTINKQFTPCKVKEIHAEFMAMAASSDCTAAKVQVIAKDNPDMALDQQLAIAYAFCKKEIVDSLIN